MVLKSKLLAPALLLAIGWITLELIEIKQQNGIADREIGEVNSRIEKTGKSNEELKLAIDNFNDPEFLEREAKEKLNYRRQDEQVAFIYKSDGVASSSVGVVSLPNYKKWFYYLLGIEK